MSEVTCKICGKSTSKRHSLHIGNGERACREHPETQALADKAHGVIEAQHAATQQKWKPTHEPQQWDPRPKCMVCDHVGLRSDEFFTRLLIENEKYTMTTGKLPNFFDTKEMQKTKGSLTGVACLLPIELDVIKQRHIKLTRIGWQVAQMLNLAFVCADCVNKLNLPNPLPQPTFEQISEMAIVAELIRPEVQRIAGEELVKDQ